MNKSQLTLSIVKLLFILGLTFGPLFIIWRLIYVPAHKPPSFSGLDVLHSCVDKPAVVVTLSPINNSQNVLVSIFIKNWEDIKEHCESIQIHFPGLTENQQYVLGWNSWADFDEYVQHHAWNTLDEKTRRAFPSTEIKHDSLIDEDVINLDSHKLEVGFSGIVELLWVNGLIKTDFERLNLFLPFRATVYQDNKLQGTQNYRVTLLSMKDYELTSKIPEATAFKSMGNNSFYYFDVDANKTQMSLTFENRKLAGEKNLLLVVFSTLLGIGLTLATESILTLGKARIVKGMEAKATKPKREQNREQDEVKTSVKNETKRSKGKNGKKK